MTAKQLYKVIKDRPNRVIVKTVHGNVFAGNIKYFPSDSYIWEKKLAYQIHIDVSTLNPVNACVGLHGVSRVKWIHFSGIKEIKIVN